MNSPRTPAQRTYMRAVEMADRMLAEGLPVMGVASSADGASFNLWVDMPGRGSEMFNFPEDVAIMVATAYVRSAVGGDQVHD